MPDACRESDGRRSRDDRIKVASRPRDASVDISLHLPLLAMTSTTSCSAAPPASCPTSAFVCDISAQVPLYNLTGLGGQLVCQIGLPPANVSSSVLNSLAQCCTDKDPSNIRIQDDCVHYCAIDGDEDEFQECLHGFLTSGFIGRCQNVSETVDTGELTTNPRLYVSIQTTDRTAIGRAEIQQSRVGWASLALLILSISAVLV